MTLQHPGGDEVMLGEGGRDATEAFEDVGHSDEAREILAKYYVGRGPEVRSSSLLPLAFRGSAALVVSQRRTTCLRITPLSPGK